MIPVSSYLWGVSSNLFQNRLHFSAVKTLLLSVDQGVDSIELRLTVEIQLNWPPESQDPGGRCCCHPWHRSNLGQQWFPLQRDTRDFYFLSRSGTKNDQFNYLTACCEVNSVGVAMGVGRFALDGWIVFWVCDAVWRRIGVASVTS